MEHNKILPNLYKKSNKEGKEVLWRYKVIEPFLREEKSLSNICKERQIALRTARRWVACYKQKGLTGLTRAKRKDKGKRRSCLPELQKLIEGLYLKQPHLSMASIHRRIKGYAIKHNQKYPAYRTVCYIISQLPQGLTTLAHEGSKAYKQSFDLLYNHEAACPNDIWQVDHVLLDIMIVDGSSKKVERPWLTVIMDDYSRAIAGYELSFLAPSALKTALCLRHAIWRKKEVQWCVFGIPNILYTDHGSDFTSRHIEQVCIDLKIRLIFSQIGEPRGRGKIERFFRTLNQILLSGLDGYTENKNTTAKLSLSELDALIQNFIIDYNQRLHPTIQETPKGRWEKNGFLPRMPDSIEQLDLLLLTVVKPRMIRRDGIWFQGLRYLDPILADYVGESVTIRYNPTDITSIRVFYKNQYLCQPICQALEAQSISLKDIQTARNNRRKALQKEIRDRVSLVDAILISKQQTGALSIPEKSKKPTKLKLYTVDE